MNSLDIDIEQIEEEYQIVIKNLRYSEIYSLLMIFDRATSTNTKAKEFLEKLKDAIDKTFPKD